MKTTRTSEAPTSKADHGFTPHLLYDEYSDAAHGNYFWFPPGGVFFVGFASLLSMSCSLMDRLQCIDR